MYPPWNRFSTQSYSTNFSFSSFFGGATWYLFQQKIVPKSALPGLGALQPGLLLGSVEEIVVLWGALLTLVEILGWWHGDSARWGLRMWLWVLVVAMSSRRKKSTVLCRYVIRVRIKHNEIRLQELQAPGVEVQGWALFKIRLPARSFVCHQCSGSMDTSCVWWITVMKYHEVIMFWKRKVDGMPYNPPIELQQQPGYWLRNFASVRATELRSFSVLF